MLTSLALSIGMFAVFLLVIGGAILIRRGERQRGLLMIVAALVILANVAIWALPMPAA